MYEFDAPDTLETIRIISEAWLAAEHDPSHPSYQALAGYVSERFAELWGDGGVDSYSFHLVQGTPYASSDDMFQDISDNRHLKVFAGGSPFAEGHPFSKIAPGIGHPWTVSHAFRAVHDLDGHFGAIGREHYPFETVIGEYRAFKRESMHCPTDGLAALLSESIGQLAVHQTTGDYVKEQQAVIMSLPADLLVELIT